jgi:hypothetical protein
LWVAQLELLGAFVVLVDRAAGAAGQLAGTRDDRVEHCLDVQRRADGPADLAQRRQLLDGAAQLARPSLQRREQPHVLDGDDGLVGEGPQQLHMCIGEPVDLPMGNGDGPNHVVLPSHRYTHHTSRATRPNVRARFWTEI